MTCDTDFRTSARRGLRTQLEGVSVQISFSRVPVTEEPVCVCLRDSTDYEKPRYLNVRMSQREALAFGKDLVKFAEMTIPEEENL